jgi:2-iminobutanoate/2-iminopropanoate deaminase
MIITPIQAPGTALPAGHYSQAIVANGLVYVSGQLPVDLTTGTRDTGPLADQTRRVLANLRAVLQASGSDLDLLLSVTVYLTDVALWGEFNAVYAEELGAHRPARTVVPTGPLRHGFLIEVSAVAAQRGAPGAGPVSTPG